MPAKRSPARLIVALSVAAVLAVFLLYTSIAGGGTPSLQPSQLAGHAGRVSLVGIVAGQPSGDAHAGGLHFLLGVGPFFSQPLTDSQAMAAKDPSFGLTALVGGYF